MRCAPRLALVLAIAIGSVSCWAWNDTAGAVDAPATDPEFQQLLARVRAISAEQDSLAPPDSASADVRRIRTEQIWNRQLQVERNLVAAADLIRKRESEGRDVSEPRRILGEMIHRGWPDYRQRFRAVTGEIEALIHQRDGATSAQLLAIESRISDISDRQARHLRSLVTTIQSLDRAGVDTSEPRRYVVAQLTPFADVLVTRLRMVERDRASIAAQLSRAASDQGLRLELAAVDESLRRVSANLALVIEMLDRFHVDTTRLKVALITMTGRLTGDIVNPKVLRGLVGFAQHRFVDILATNAPAWLFRGLILVAILAGSRLLASLTRVVVRRAVTSAQFSQLMRETLISGSTIVVMGVGWILALTQLGVEIGTLFAGLGIAGFVIGFAMQNTLSNFAAGGMILFEKPYDLGDEIVAGDAAGTVKAMSLVATTIVTADNQTLIVPNSKIWGDVIRNITAQRTRRVDMTFGVGYVDDLDKAEKILSEILAGDDKVLKDPPPVVKLHQLADGGVNFIVRPWARKEHYWDVYWAITRAVKQRFDEEGISMPGARRDLYLHTVLGKEANTE